MFPSAKILNTNINNPLVEYDRFVAYMNTNLTNGTWASLQPQNPCGWPALNKGTPVKMDLAISQQGTMYGTPWGDRPRWDATCFRALQHCFPTSNTFQYSNEHKLYCVYFTSVNAQYNPYVALNRNGYQSLGSGTRDAGVIINEFIYFDHLQLKMMHLNPSAKSNPQPYIF